MTDEERVQQVLRGLTETPSPLFMRVALCRWTHGVVQHERPEQPDRAWYQHVGTTQSAENTWQSLVGAFSTENRLGVVGRPGGGAFVLWMVSPGEVLLGEVFHATQVGVAAAELQAAADEIRLLRSPARM